MRQPSKEKVEQYRREFSEVLKDFMAQTIGKMLQAELDEFLGYEEYKCSHNTNLHKWLIQKAINIPSGQIKVSDKPFLLYSKGAYIP